MGKHPNEFRSRDMQNDTATLTAVVVTIAVVIIGSMGFYALYQGRQIELEVSHGVTKAKFAVTGSEKKIE